MLDLSSFEALFSIKMLVLRVSLNYVDLLSVNVMISCYALALWVLNMIVKFHSLGLPQSLSLEMEIRIYLLLPVKRATFEAIFTLMRR